MLHNDCVYLPSIEEASGQYAGSLAASYRHAAMSISASGFETWFMGTPWNSPAVAGPGGDVLDDVAVAMELERF
jgi:hypothetical protein